MLPLPNMRIRAQRLGPPVWANFDFWATFLCGLFWDVGYFRTWPMLGYLGPPVGYSGTACVGYLLCGLLGTACVGVPCVGCVRVSMGRGSP